jgi:hypothetical protein
MSWCRFVIALTKNDKKWPFLAKKSGFLHESSKNPSALVGFLTESPPEFRQFLVQDPPLGRTCA